MYNIKQLMHPETVAEASKLLVQNPEAMIIAGGTDVLIKVREGHIEGGTFVSLQRIEELRKIEVVDGNVVIGALSTFNDVYKSEIIKDLVPIMVQATKDIGGPQLRNSGTVGGNICNGITSADTASSLLTLNATLEIYGVDGVRQVPITDFYISHAKVKLNQGDVLTKIIVKPNNFSGFNGGYIKYAPRKAMDIAVVGCAVNLKLSDDLKTVEDIRFGFGACSPVPMRAYKTEEFVKGKELTEELVNAIGEYVSEEVNPRDSWKGSREFRVHIAQELAKRIFKSAVEEAGGIING